MDVARARFRLHRKITPLVIVSRLVPAHAGRQDDNRLRIKEISTRARAYRADNADRLNALIIAYSIGECRMVNSLSHGTGQCSKITEALCSPPEYVLNV